MNNNNSQNDATAGASTVSHENAPSVTEPPIITSISQELHQQLSSLLVVSSESSQPENSSSSTTRGWKFVEQTLVPQWEEPADAYVQFLPHQKEESDQTTHVEEQQPSSSSLLYHQGHAPNIRADDIRKGYTWLFWIRPTLDEDPATSTITTTATRAPDTTTIPRILYRMATSPDNTTGTGISVSCSSWRVVAGGSSGDNQEKDEDPPTTIATTLTAYSFPSTTTTTITSTTPYAKLVQQEIVLQCQTWQLVGITHTYPYLRKPVWTVTVDGAPQGDPQELQYPVLLSLLAGNNNKRGSSTSTTNPAFDYVTVFQNITAGGCTRILHNNDNSNTLPSSDRSLVGSVEKPDDQKTASELAAQAATRHPDTSTTTTAIQVIPMRFDVAAVALYSESIPPTMQAILAEAGVCYFQQTNAKCLLPPVPNWSKGCSLSSGPKVGIPLTVHGISLELQMAMDSCLWGFSATHAFVLGNPENDPKNPCSRRILIPSRIAPSSTASAPRVGLVQPASPHRREETNMEEDEEDAPNLYLTGRIRLVHRIQQHYYKGQQQQNAQLTDPTLSTNNHFTLHWSLAWTEQQAVTFTILPLFLALTPPGAESQVLFEQSWRHLYAVYSEQGKLAAALIRLLARLIDTGGARIHEEILQNGILHVLAHSLRSGLVRAFKFKLLHRNEQTQQSQTSLSLEEFLKRAPKLEEAVGGTTTVSPPYIPLEIVQAIVQLLDVCCGHPNGILDVLSPKYQIRRTSDLALTALFGLAWEFELWGGDATAASVVFQTVAAKYGRGICLTTGYVLRAQISIQHLLDRFRLLRFESKINATTTDSALESIALSFTQVILSMLLSSLSNQRSITQSEKDIAACVSALSDCPLGTVTADVVLSTLVAVLVWCEILPPEALPRHYHDILDHPHGGQQNNQQQQSKVDVASRLGRNLLISQFHDVMAPVLLSRTVFSGETTLVPQNRLSGLPSTESQTLPSHSTANDKAESSSLRWQHHWRLTLLLYSWIASIAGPEGLVTSKSTGSLMLASGLAGSLEGALDEANKIVISALFMPSPSIALLIGSSLRSEWSYKDLLADRLQIMMPILPGMVTALLSRQCHTLDTTSAIASIPKKALINLAEILTAVGGTFHRVYGGVIHYSTLSYRQSVKTKSDGSSDAVKAAKTYVPHLLVVAMILENHIVSLRQTTIQQQHEQPLIVQFISEYNPRFIADDQTNAEMTTTSSDDLAVNDIIVAMPPEQEGEFKTEQVVKFLQHCQKSVMSIASGLISNAMSLGGAGSTVPLWKSILSTVDESILYSASSARGTRKNHEMKNDDDSIIQAVDNNVKDVIDNTKSVDQDDAIWNGDTNVAATDLLCRLLSVVMSKAMQRERHWDVWGYELCSALSRVCFLIEERSILEKPQTVSDGSAYVYKEDQIRLICSIIDILIYGRNNAGWCQLALPSMSPPEQGGGKGPKREMTSNSKLLLPILNPCLRILLASIHCIPRYAKIAVIDSGESLNITDCTKETVPPEESLFARVIAELDQTLTAAIVGLSFLNAREIALTAMATCRTFIRERQNISEDDAFVGLCKSLFAKLAEELRVRYQSERRLRDNALFDAYEDDGSNSAQEAAHGSLAIERLILGAESIFDKSINESIEEITFGETERSPPRKKNGQDDFVLFHEHSPASQEAKGILGFKRLQGLGSTLEEWHASLSSELGEDERFCLALHFLQPYLDACDEVLSQDANDTEVVKLFDTGSQSSDRQMQLPMVGSQTAADAMSVFFEFAAAEKSRLKEILLRFLPSHRYSRMSFSERFCWARYTELTPHTVQQIWERSMPDGNRDVRSRICTTPCISQFRRYLPKHLDLEAEIEPETTQEAACEEKVADAAFSPRRASSVEDIDAFTKSLLKAGNLAIVDITKKENYDEDDLPDPFAVPADGIGDEDEAELFTESEIASEAPVQGTKIDSGALEENAHEDLDSGSEDLNVSDPNLHSDLSNVTTDFVGKGHHSITTSSFSTPPDNSSSSLSLMHSAAAGMIEQHFDHCLHVKAEGSRHCSMLLTQSHLILEYDINQEGFFEGELLAKQEEADRQRMADDVGAQKDRDPESLKEFKDEKRKKEEAALRPKSIRWNLSEVSHVYLRRYRLRDSALELFVIPTGGTAFGGFGLASPGSSLFLDFGSGHSGKIRRDEAANAIMKRAPPQAIRQWPDRSEQFLHDQLSRLTLGWVEGRISNFDYLLHLNILSGRSYNDICQYPVFPWVLANYSSEEIPDLTDANNFRDLTKPVGALNPDRLKDFTERFKTFSDPSIPPFMYGSHYSTSAGVVLHFLVRLHPFAGLHRQLQGGHFDVADRLFSSVPRTWAMCTGSSAAEVKELTPEWYCNPAFLRNANNFKLGRSQDGEVLGDVALPPWAKGSPEKFVEVMRAALESDICSEKLSDWIDLIFGRKQQGPEAIKANNVFFYLTYYGSVDVASIKDEALRVATELQIAHFGQCPMQLFRRPHVRRLPRTSFRLSFYQLLCLHSQQRNVPNKTTGETKHDVQSASADRARLHSVFGEPLYLPFFSAPLSHWMHSDPPPPGPHAALVAVRFAGTDRCLAVDAKGIFHYFRWAWRAEESIQVAPGEEHFDRGCFVAQRELPRFRRVPRLLHKPAPGERAVVVISKTLFANRSVLLVLSDGDGRGSFAMQLVDPAKGDVKGEVVVPSVHSARISCIATDPIGTASGHGGVGGELAIVGSCDGSASLWRFMSSHFLPLRPRLRFSGHSGKRIVAVAICSTNHIAATMSSDKCCIHSIGNGTMIRCFGPPNDALDMDSSDGIEITTKFADTPALSLSVQGYVVAVCETTIHSTTSPDRTVITLNLFTVEGVPLGSKPLENWRGVPHRLYCSPDGTTVLVCCGRGVTMHRLSACQPLEFLDEFQVTESDDFSSGQSIIAACDADFGPVLNRPVVAAAGCSSGALRLHALPGISAWSERHKKSGFSSTVGSALATPARRLKGAVKDGLGIGRQIAGIGRDLQRELSLQEKGVGSLVGNLFRKKSFS